jgi:hypothetical protein
MSATKRSSLDAIGKKYGRLFVLNVKLVARPSSRPPGHRKYYVAVCLCDCGVEKEILAPSVMAGHTKSCGCYNLDALSINKRKHGLSKSRVYRIWRHMRNRCHLLTHPRYAEWGGRGITVCERWHTFENFLDDMGQPPDGYSIDRIDNNSGYFKDNCRWSDKYEQAQNKNWPLGTGVRKRGSKFEFRMQLNGQQYREVGFLTYEDALARRESLK